MIQEFKIDGELCSKSNSRRIILRGKHPRVIKSQKALDYVAMSLPQIRKQRTYKTFENYVGLEVHVWYASRRPDLDISLIQDILQDAGVYKNDRQVIEIKALKYLDKEKPRVIAKVYELDKESVLASGL